MQDSATVGDEGGEAEVKGKETAPQWREGSVGIRVQSQPLERTGRRGYSSADRSDGAASERPFRGGGASGKSGHR